MVDVNAWARGQFTLAGPKGAGGFSELRQGFGEWVTLFGPLGGMSGNLTDVDKALCFLAQRHFGFSEPSGSGGFSGGFPPPGPGGLTPFPSLTGGEGRLETLGRGKEGKTAQTVAGHLGP